jgi:hypothetical protein
MSGLEHNDNPTHLMYYRAMHNNDPRVGEAEQINPTEIEIARKYAAAGIKPWSYYGHKTMEI